jgi:P2-related tail formation protein
MPKSMTQVLLSIVAVGSDPAGRACAFVPWMAWHAAVDAFAADTDSGDEP